MLIENLQDDFISSKIPLMTNHTAVTEAQLTDTNNYDAKHAHQHDPVPYPKITN